MRYWSLTRESGCSDISAIAGLGGPGSSLGVAQVSGREEPLEAETEVRLGLRDGFAEGSRVFLCQVGRVRPSGQGHH